MSSDDKPEWLEDIITLESHKGDYEAFLNYLYKIFKRDFIDNRLEFEGSKVLCDTTEQDGRCKTFVHVTTETNEATGERNLCLRRCERVAWIKLIILNANGGDVLVWEKYHRKGKIRVNLYLPSENFLIVLDRVIHKDGGICFYVATAIYVDYKWKHGKHLRDFEKYQKQKSPL